MPKTAKKIVPPVAKKRSSITLLDGRTTIKLPLAPNPVHMLQGFLEEQLAKELPRNGVRVAERHSESAFPGGTRLTAQIPRPEKQGNGKK